MSDIAIKVENLSKRYRIGLKEELPDTFMAAMKGWITSPFNNLQRLRKLTQFDDAPDKLGRTTDKKELITNNRSSDNSSHNDDIIWALKDVSFEVKRGEVLGIIGRNGAGKSTLLKILSRITEPTSGRAIINGRVSSLLEVGTGFHPELTGRENIYLNGTILGMSKAEVDQKFDQIVDFSGVEKFIDTPVKRYSSGMKVRLAFAVAAHLEPEILLVDEVLAVGDIGFQKKCLGKMEDVTSEGRTVLFVSHNMGMVRNLCQHAILLERGHVRVNGTTNDAIDEYLSWSQEKVQEGVVYFDCEDQDGWFTDVVCLEKVSILQKHEIVKGTVDAANPLDIEVHYVLKTDVNPCRVKLRLTSQEGLVFHTDDTFGNQRLESRKAGRYVSRCRIPAHLLNIKKYCIVVGIDQPSIQILVPFTEALNFDVIDTSGMTKYDRNWPGAIRPVLNWECHSYDL